MEELLILLGALDQVDDLREFFRTLPGDLDPQIRRIVRSDYVKSDGYTGWFQLTDDLVILSSSDEKTTNIGILTKSTEESYGSVLSLEGLRVYVSIATPLFRTILERFLDLFTDINNSENDIFRLGGTQLRIYESEVPNLF
jgi:hypothetical protein